MTPAHTELEAYHFCPRCAASASVDRGALRCSACNLDMYFTPKMGATLVVTDSTGRVAVTRRARNPYIGTLDGIGGFINIGETFEECALRELQEETGLIASQDRLHYVGSETHLYTRKGITYHVVSPYFRITITDAEKEAMTPMDDVASFEWYLPQDLPKEEFYDSSIYDLLTKL